MDHRLRPCALRANMAITPAGQWQLLEIARPALLAKMQQQLLNKKNAPRNIDFTGAYIDSLVLNVYGGPGPTARWIDDLEIGPVQQARPRPSRVRTTRIPRKPRASRAGKPSQRRRIQHGGESEPPDRGQQTLSCPRHPVHRYHAAGPPQCRLQHGVLRRQRDGCPRSGSRRSGSVARAGASGHERSAFVVLAG